MAVDSCFAIIVARQEGEYIPFSGYLCHMILFIPLKGSWAQNIFSMFAFIKKIQIEYKF